MAPSPPPVHSQRFVTLKPSLVLKIMISFNLASCDLTFRNLKPSLVLWNDQMILMMSCFVKSQFSFYREGHIANDICKVLVISESSKCWVHFFLKVVLFAAMFFWALYSCSCLDWLQKKLSEKKKVWRKEKLKFRFIYCVLIDIWEKFLLICFHWKHLFKNINVFLVPLLFRGKAYIVWNSNSWEFPVATKNATWRCFLRREQPIESSCRILGMPSLNKQTHSRKKSS